MVKHTRVWSNWVNGVLYRENKGADQLHGYCAAGWAFVFACAKIRFFHDTAHMLFVYLDTSFEPTIPSAIHKNTVELLIKRGLFVTYLFENLKDKVFS